MENTRKECAICELTRYYLVHWKHDMACSICGKIWKIPINQNEEEASSPTADENSPDEIIRNKVKLQKRQPSPVLDPEYVTILCPNEWCTHQNRITRQRVPTAMLEMKR